MSQALAKAAVWKPLTVFVAKAGGSQKFWRKWVGFQRWILIKPHKFWPRHQQGMSRHKIQNILKVSLGLPVQMMGLAQSHHNFNGKRFRSQQWPAEKKRGCDRVLHRTISSRCLQRAFTTTAPAGRSCAGTKRPRPSLEMECVHIGPSIWCFFHLIYLIVWWTNPYMYIWQDIP